MSGPLDGVRVIDLTGTVLGPMGTQLLGDAGADVIKIEAPAGDPIRHIGPRRSGGMGAYFLNLNRNKRSVVLDLKRPEAHAALLRLIAGSDVFVHNMRPSAAARLGLDYASLAAQFPRLIHASASGYRLGSARQDDPAYDDIIQGEAAIASVNGSACGADGPRYVPSVMADKITGHVLAASVGMALYHRERTGQGQALHVPMLDTTLAFFMPEHLWGHTLAGSGEGLGYTRLLTPHRRPYPTADGHLCLIAVTDAQWARLLPVLERPELAQDPRFATMRGRAENVDAVYGVLAAELRRRSTGDWLQRLAAADIPHGPANSLEDLLDDPYLAGFFRPAAHPTEGDTITLAPPVAYSASPVEIRRLAPALGEHTAELLAEVGYSEQQISNIIGISA